MARVVFPRRFAPPVDRLALFVLRSLPCSLWGRCLCPLRYLTTSQYHLCMFSVDLLKGRVALVTGGGTGICRGIAHAFASHGCDVAITSRKIEHLEPTAVELRGRGVRAVAHPADVR